MRLPAARSEAGAAQLRAWPLGGAHECARAGGPPCVGEPSCRVKREAGLHSGHKPALCPTYLRHPCRRAQAQAGAAEASARADAADARARELADEAAAARAELATAGEEAAGAADAAAAAAAAELAAVRGAADGAAADRAAVEAKAKADMKARAGLQGLWHRQRMGCRQVPNCYLYTHGPVQQLTLRGTFQLVRDAERSWAEADLSRACHMAMRDWAIELH
jgi:hypothetical protein